MNKEKKAQTEKSVSIFWMIMIAMIIQAAFIGGLIGAFDGNIIGGIAKGALWGVPIGIAGYIIVIVYGKAAEWFQKELKKGSSFVYMLIGVLCAIAISGYLALSLGNPTCIDRDTEPRGGCLEYDNDGYVATTDQRWAKFWSSLPITLVIACLAAALVHSKTQAKK